MIAGNSLYYLNTAVKFLHERSINIYSLRVKLLATYLSDGCISGCCGIFLLILYLVEVSHVISHIALRMDFNNFSYDEFF